jgi:hypothetical protein
MLDNGDIAADSFAIDHLTLDQVIEPARGQGPCYAALSHLYCPLLLEMVVLSKVHAASKGHEDFQGPAAFSMADSG